MKNYFPMLQKSPLFQGISPEAFPSLSELLNARKISFQKNQFLLHRGEPLPGIGLVLSGQVDILQEDFWGNRSILNRIPAGRLFGEVYVCLNIPPEVSILAAEDCEILFLDLSPLFDPQACRKDPLPLLAQNLTRLFAARSLELTRKMTHLSRRSLREKLLSYLSQQALEQGKEEFSIPFDRQQLADFLSADRSALSAELGRMRKEGLLDFRKNHFRLFVEN